MPIELHDGDLPDALTFGDCVAIDTETMGLIPARDRLCLVQLSAGDGNCHMVQFRRGAYDAPNLKRLLADPGGDPSERLRPQPPAPFRGRRSAADRNSWCPGEDSNFHDISATGT